MPLVLSAWQRSQAGGSPPSSRRYGHLSETSGALERGHGAWAKASCPGSAAITSTHRRQLSIFMRRKPFQSVRGGGGGKKKTPKPLVEVFVSGFILCPSWLSTKVLSGVWPMFYFIIKGGNIAFSNVSASLSKSNILNIQQF